MEKDNGRHSRSIIRQNMYRSPTELQISNGLYIGLQIPLHFFPKEIPMGFRLGIPIGKIALITRPDLASSLTV